MNQYYIYFFHKVLVIEKREENKLDKSKAAKYIATIKRNKSNIIQK